jgi:hypothetical protein
MKALLNFLSDRKLSGSVMVRSGAGTGVIILAEGDLAGAYTSESRDISDKPDRVLALCDDPAAMIEVKAADSTKHPPLDVEEVVAGQRRPAQSGLAASPAPAPPQPEPVQSSNPTLPIMPTMQPLPPEPPTAQIPTPQFSGFAPPAPGPVAPTAPPRSGGQQLDWGAIVAELQAMAEDALGNRARKVKDILGAADPSQAGIEAAIDQIPSISLLFVDSSRLEQLAQEMRARLKAHL